MVITVSVFSVKYALRHNKPLSTKDGRKERASKWTTENQRTLRKVGPKLTQGSDHHEASSLRLNYLQTTKHHTSRPTLSAVRAANVREWKDTQSTGGNSRQKYQQYQLIRRPLPLTKLKKEAQEMLETMSVVFLLNK
jgi:hypothetical protein